MEIFHKARRDAFSTDFSRGDFVWKIVHKKENWNSFHVCVENFVGNVEKKWNVKKDNFF